MKKVYLKPEGKTDLEFDAILQDKLKEQKQNTDTDSSQVPTCEAICGAKYRRAFWVLFFVHTFVQ